MRFPVPHLMGALLLLGLLLPGPAAASVPAEAAVTIGPETRSIALSNRLAYTLEGAGMDINTVDAQRNNLHWERHEGEGALRLGYQGQEVWLTFTVRNEMPKPVDLTLEVGWPLLARLMFFVDQAEGWHAAAGGYLAEAETTGLVHRHEIFALSLEPYSERRVYLRVDSDGIIMLPVTLWQRQAFVDHSQNVSILLGLLFGVLGGILLYNLSLALLTREPAYVSYVCYVAAVIALQANLTGIGRLYLWGDLGWFNGHSYSLTSAMSFGTATLFSIRFLELRRNSPRLFSAARLVLAGWIGIFLLTPFVTKQTLGLVGFPLGLGTCALAFFGALYLAFKGSRSAVYFVIAWSFLIIGTGLYISSMAGVIPRTPFTEHAQSVGILVEVILLSLALADRINRTNAERVSAQQHALAMTEQLAVERAEKIEAQNAVLAVQRRTTEELEERVRERTLELEAALAELNQANLQLEQASITDPLTGCYNRRYFDSQVTRLVKQASRAGEALTLMFLDIDHFKQINDRYGHAAGDQCLKAVARVIQAQFGRAGDLLARYGGEEFVAVLPATVEAPAFALAESIRKTVERQDIRVGGVVIKLTLSIGVASWVPDPQESGKHLLAAADKALYRAKSSGRNRVEVAAADIALGQAPRSQD